MHYVHKQTNIGDKEATRIRIREINSTEESICIGGNPTGYWTYSAR